MSIAEIIAEMPRLSASELDAVQAKLNELIKSSNDCAKVTAHPALGIWKDRNDLPQDAVEASRFLRERMMRVAAAD